MVDARVSAWATRSRYARLLATSVSSVPMVADMVSRAFSLNWSIESIVA